MLSLALCRVLPTPIVSAVATPYLSSQARVQVDESCADNVSSLNRLIVWSTLPPQAGRLEDPRADDRVGKLLESEIRLDRKQEDNI